MRLIGLSATPFHKRQGNVYSNVVNVRSTNQLIEAGHLVRLRPFVSPGMDFSRVKLNSMGEYDAASVGEAGAQLMGKLVPQYEDKCDKLFDGRRVKFIVFSASVQDGARVCEAFNEAGIPCEQVSYLDTNKEEREARINAHRAGELRGLVSCEALQRGYDVTDIEMVIDRRAYRKSLSAVLQMYGRGMRGHPGKEFCCLLDMSTNYARMQNDIEDFYEYGIQELEKASDLDTKVRDQVLESKECPVCGLIVASWREPCPQCGFKPERKAAASVEEPEEADVNLVEIGPRNRRVKLPFSRDDVWWQLVGWAYRGGGDTERSKKWALAQYYGLFKSWPKHKFDVSKGHAQVDSKVIQQVRNNVLAYRIRMDKGRAKGRR